MQGLEFRSLPFELRAASEDGGEFEGMATVWYVPSDGWFAEIMQPGAFADTLPIFLAEGFVGGINHDWDQPIGRPILAEETTEGLHVKGSISDTVHGRDVRTLMKDGVIKRLSIGFRCLGREYLETAEEVLAWWAGQGYVPTAEDIAKVQFGARIVTRTRLYEFSPVAVPAQGRAVISEVRGERMGSAFADHSARVLSELTEYVGRLRSLRDKRGGDLSPNHRAGFRRLRAELEAVLGAGAPGEERKAGPEPAPEAGRLYAEFLRIQAGLMPGKG